MFVVWVNMTMNRPPMASAVALFIVRDLPRRSDQRQHERHDQRGRQKWGVNEDADIRIEWRRQQLARQGKVEVDPESERPSVPIRANW